MKSTTNMDLAKIAEEIYAPCGLKMSNLVPDSESQEYDACSFEMQALHILARKAKITPKKIGQFVTLWKRDLKGETTPFDASDKIDLIVITTSDGAQLGQFVFPKKILMDQGIISQPESSGKRGFRVYPPWAKPSNKTAQNTQKWQLNYFLTIEANFKTDLGRASVLFNPRIDHG